MTRREQFIQRQEKYRERRNAMYRRGWKFRDGVSPIPGPHYPIRVRDGRKTPLWNGPVQYRGEVKGSGGHGPITAAAAAGLIAYHVTAASQHVPPVVALDGFLAGLFGPPGTKRQRDVLIGYGRRRLHAVGRKPDRLTGYQRSCRGAAWRAITDGYFPDWDPLHGTPTLADIEAGAPFYSGPFRQTPH